MHLDSVCERLSSYVFIAVVCDLMAVSSRHVKRQCEASDINILSSRGVKIEPFSMSKVELSTNEFYKSGEKLSFDFKTKYSRGLLFYGIHRGSTERSEILALWLVEGRLVFNVRCSLADLDLHIHTSRLDDGNWHSIEFRRKGLKGFIVVDGRPYYRRYHVKCKLNTFVIGGMDSADAMILFPPIPIYDGHFEGCIRNLHVSSGLTTRPNYFAVSSCH
ncbi:sex hormone-binding globulin-like [Gigantopelta aegis]|uniref:sex hormone-binding globulin-like n=1 Tax=Gigantopelta aegis TaxID=1735272 RepID=UPI001B888955|nr:sex hormone-binding globulin-like [Gigantopelta aegis]